MKFAHARARARTHTHTHTHTCTCECRVAKHMFHLQNVHMAGLKLPSEYGTHVSYGLKHR